MAMCHWCPFCYWCLFCLGRALAGTCGKGLVKRHNIKALMSYESKPEQAQALGFRRIHGPLACPGWRMRVAVMVLLLSGMLLPAFFIMAAPALAQQAPATLHETSRNGAGSDAAPPLRVFTKPIAPFVIIDEDGQARGFSIDLWEALARRLGRPYALEVVPDLNSLLKAVRNGEADVAIAAITITAQREREMDFSHPFFRSGLQIMVRNDDNAGFLAQAWEVLRGLFDSRSFRLALWTLVGIILVAGNLIWLLERQRNEHFRRSWPRGLWDGTYWALVTISTVGYGDKVPRSEGGKVLASILIVVGYLAYAWFTASIAATLTVSHLKGVINGPEDLRGRLVATVAHSTSDEWLRRMPGVRVRAVPRIEQAYDLLASGTVDAVVYDFPALHHHVLQDSEARFRVVGPVFKGEDYGIALPQGSPLRESLNGALLELMESGEHESIRRKWLGAPAGSE